MKANNQISHTHFREKTNSRGIKYVVSVDGRNETPFIGFFKDFIYVAMDLYTVESEAIAKDIYLKGKSFKFTTSEDLIANLN